MTTAEGPQGPVAAEALEDWIAVDIPSQAWRRRTPRSRGEWGGSGSAEEKVTHVAGCEVEPGTEWRVHVTRDLTTENARRTEDLLRKELRRVLVRAGTVNVEDTSMDVARTSGCGDAETER